jgi:hypothetical protein
VKPETIRRLDALFAEHPVLVAEPGPPDEIDRAEARIGMKLDPAHREFIARYGGAMVGHLPIFGLRVSEVMGIDDFLAEVTARFRADGWTPTDQWIVFSYDQGGNPIGLDAAGAVWVSDHDAGEVIQLAATFEDFLEQLLDKIT